MKWVGGENKVVLGGAYIETHFNFLSCISFPSAFIPLFIYLYFIHLHFSLAKITSCRYQNRSFYFPCLTRYSSIAEIASNSITTTWLESIIDPQIASSHGIQLLPPTTTTHFLFFQALFA